LPIKRIEKMYKLENQTTNLVFQAESNFAYILVWRGFSKDLSIFKEAVRTFQINVPFSEKIKGKGIGTWIIVIIGIGILYLFGKGGLFIRKGVETKKALRKVRNEAYQKGWKITKKWHEFKIKSTVWIAGPVLVCILFYVFIFIILPLKLFLFCLVGVIAMMLGYFGIVFKSGEGLFEDIE